MRKDGRKLFVRSMGKTLQVTAIATSDDAANAYMSRNPDDAVVAVFDGLVFMADKYDKGTARRAEGPQT